MTETTASRNEVFETIVRHTREVVPSLEGHQFEWGDSLRDLGANSVDRADILMLTLESLTLDIAIVELGHARNIQELVDIIYDKS